MMKTGQILVSFVLFFSTCHGKSRSFLRSNDPPDPEEYAKSNGYYSEGHTVVTPDGYILSLHRLLSPGVDLSTTSPEPFILQHGLFANSAQWNILEPKQNLGYILADNGFDVWLTNIRGNAYSRRHTHLTPDSRQFWNYSWHEHGTIDLPVLIDYILNTTRHKKVWYSGHSMGTTMFFVMASMRPEYNNKIRHMFALAPVAYMSHLQSSSSRNIAPHVRALETFAKTTLNGVFKTDYLLIQFTKFGFCRIVKKPCADYFNSEAGYNPRANNTIIQEGLRYFPDFASAGQIAHYGQLINNEFTFRMYDYYDQNTAKYGSKEPPTYPVEKITAPITFLYSSNDNFASTVDVEEFSKRIKNVNMYLIPDPKFNHLDFITSGYASEIVYRPMLQMIQELRIKKQM